MYGQDSEAHLLDLSEPMLLRAATRLGQLNQAPIQAIQADFRVASLADHAYDVVLAAAVLHHLRDEADWEQAFQELHRITASGGSVWITDLVAHETPAVQEMMWSRYGEYLTSLQGNNKRIKVSGTNGVVQANFAFLRP